MKELACIYKCLGCGDTYVAPRWHCVNDYDPGLPCYHDGEGRVKLEECVPVKEGG